MDKNTIIGLLLIGVIILTFSIFNKPTPGKSTPSVRDSAVVNTTDSSSAVGNSQTTADVGMEADSLRQKSISESMGSLADCARGTESFAKLRNNLLAVEVSSLGGMPVQAELCKYKARQSKPLYLFRPGDIRINLPLLTIENKMVNTSDLYFKPISQTDSSLVMRLGIDSVTYLDFSYLLRKDDYRLFLSISGKHLDRILPANMTMQKMEWQQCLPQQEISWKFENQYSLMQYKFRSGDVKGTDPNKADATESINEPLRWVAFKDKYFSSVIALLNGSFEGNKLETKTLGDKSGYTKSCNLTTTFPFNTRQETCTNFMFFFGPNDFNLLKGYDKGIEKENQLNLERLVDLGWTLFRWINQYLIIPTVEFLRTFISNWGIIILVLTILIKLLLSPFTYKSYKSQAKMRVLKPQVDEINGKYPGKDQESMMKRNQETMKLYKMAGASPMSGCLPMLFQMPFLIALYMYFPTSILLRGESFLWAKDLSTYDPIYSWTTNIPIISSFYGNHVSLFCLLWAITNIFYTKYTMGQQSNSAAMPGMKWMPYIMTVMFLSFFNNNSSGLCYYYFISTLITILQYVFFRFAINEGKLLAQLEANKRKPQKKSKWIARMEEMQRQQQKHRR